MPAAARARDWDEEGNVSSLSDALCCCTAQARLPATALRLIGRAAGGLTGHVADDEPRESDNEMQCGECGWKSKSVRFEDALIEIDDANAADEIESHVESDQARGRGARGQHGGRCYCSLPLAGTRLLLRRR